MSRVKKATIYAAAILSVCVLLTLAPRHGWRIRDDMPPDEAVYNYDGTGIIDGLVRHVYRSDAGEIIIEYPIFWSRNVVLETTSDGRHELKMLEGGGIEGEYTIESGSMLDEALYSIVSRDVRANIMRYYLLYSAFAVAGCYLLLRGRAGSKWLRGAGVVLIAAALLGSLRIL